MPVLTETSSIEVGSSATMKVGSTTNARAITTRCLYPPESSCGYLNRNVAGGESPTSPACGHTFKTLGRPTYVLHIEWFRYGVEDSLSWIQGLVRVLKDHLGLFLKALRAPPFRVAMSSCCPTGRQNDVSYGGIDQADKQLACRGLAAS